MTGTIKECTILDQASLWLIKLLSSNIVPWYAIVLYKSTFLHFLYLHTTIRYKCKMPRYLQSRDVSKILARNLDALGEGLLTLTDPDTGVVEL